MNDWLRRAFALALCLCFALNFALLASAEESKTTMSTEVSLKQQAVILEMPQHTALSPGQSALLEAQAAGAGLSYAWRLSRDGGKTFTAQPVSTGPTCQINNAQPNQPVTQPYVYMFAVTDQDGNTDAATVQVLVLEHQTYGTLAAAEQPVQLTGFYNENAVLVAEPRTPESPEYQALQAQVAPGCVPLLAQEIRLESTGGGPLYAGRLLLQFSVGQAYNGLTLRVFHLLPGGVEILTGTVQNGLLPIWVDSLSPFLVEVPAAPTTPTPGPTAAPGGREEPASATAVPSTAPALGLAKPDKVQRRPVTVLDPASTPNSSSQAQGPGAAAQEQGQSAPPANLLPGGQPPNQTPASPALCGCAACGLLGRLFQRPGCLCPWCWLVLAALVVGLGGLLYGSWHKWREHKLGPDAPEADPAADPTAGPEEPTSPKET